MSPYEPAEWTNSELRAASLALTRVSVDVIQFDRNELGDDYALALEFAYKKAYQAAVDRTAELLRHLS